MAISRTSFVGLGAALSTLGVQQPVLAQSAPAATPQALSRGLVLSGGGALGAYEAGIIESLAAATGVSEGQPLAPYGIICGASIGAFNAFLVATGQYAKLRSLWGTISSQHVIRLKPQFAKVTSHTAGLANRVAQAIGMATGMMKDVKGVLDGEHLRAWMVDYFDVSKPVVMTIVWAVTNLTHQRPEYFYLLPDTATPEREALALQAIRLAIGARTPIRKATRAMLIDQLRASAAVPLAFDPVNLPAPEGGIADYVDGGVTANTPISVARAVALRVDSVILNPAFTTQIYKNAFEIASGSFDTMQRRLMEDELRSAYFESFALRALRQLPAEFQNDVAKLTGVSVPALRSIMTALYETDLWVLRPAKTLPASLFGFDDPESIAETYAIGKADGAAGFVRFDPSQLSVQ